MAAFSGMALAGCSPVWIMPQYDDELELAQGVTVAALEDAFERAQQQGLVPKAVLVVSPTYFGACSDIYGEHRRPFYSIALHLACFMTSGKSLPIITKANTCLQTLGLLTKWSSSTCYSCTRCTRSSATDAFCPGLIAAAIRCNDSTLVPYQAIGISQHALDMQYLPVF